MITLALAAACAVFFAAARFLFTIGSRDGGELLIGLGVIFGGAAAATLF